MKLQKAMSRAKTATAISDLDHDLRRRRGPLLSTSRSVAEGDDDEGRTVAGTDAMDAAVQPSGQTLIDAEKTEEGGVKSAVYLYYARSIGMAATIVATLCYVAFQGFSVGANIWLSAWSSDPEASTVLAVRNKYLVVYGVLGVLQSLAIMAATLLCQVFTLNAASLLHSTMLMRILRSPMSFFDTTPLGRCAQKVPHPAFILCHGKSLLDPRDSPASRISSVITGHHYLLQLLNNLAGVT